MALASAPACATLILGAPPRESRAQGDAVYEPIAQFLTRVTGQKVVYHYVDNWLSYQSDLLNGKYDIVFDGPAFISWRIAKFGWSPLAKLPGKLKFVVIVQKNNSAQNINDIVGYTLCGFAPPNLATLVIQFQFKNPSRQPALQAVRTFSQAYHRVVTGRCQAGIMQLKLFQHMNAQTHAVRVIFTSKPLPNQAFSAGPRVPPALRARIAESLLSPQGTAAAHKLLAEFKASRLVPATTQEYSGLAPLLRNVWGFGLQTASSQ